MSHKLDLIWTAYFANGSQISQFDDANQEREHLFREVLEKQKEFKLTRFCLTNINTLHVYWVDLMAGRIMTEPAGSAMKDAGPIWGRPVEAEVSGNQMNDYRLIYFRRVTKHTQYDGRTISITGSNIDYFLGYQHTTAEGQNFKRMVQITKHDEMFMT